MKIMGVSQYKAHLSTNCKEYFHHVLELPSESEITIRDVLMKPITSHIRL